MTTFRQGAIANAGSSSTKRAGEAGFVAVLAIAFATSGVFYVNVTNSGVSSNEAARAFLTVAVTLPVALRVVSMGRLAKPQGTLLVFAPVIYMGIVAVVRFDGAEGLGPLVRWLLYGLVFIYFATLRSHRLLSVFVATTALVHLAWLARDLRLDLRLAINGAERVAGSVGSPVGFAVVLFMCAFTLLFLSWDLGSRWRLALAVVCTAGIFPTGTRTLVLAGGVALAIMGCLFVRNRTRRTLLLLLSPVGLMLSLRWVLAETQVGQRILQIDQAGTDSSWATRQYILSTVGNELSGADRIFGLGLGGFPEWFRSLTGIPNVAPHFEFLWLYAEGGAIGVALAFVALLVLTLRFAKSAMLQGSRLGAIYGIGLLWLPYTVFQLANPTFFYQAMVIYFAALGSFMSNNNAKKT